MIIDDKMAILISLKSIKRGDRVIYASGDLCDKQIRDAAWALHQSRRAVLVQRRLGPPINKYHSGKIDWYLGVGPGFEYIAIGI